MEGVILLLWAVIGALVGAAIGERRGRQGDGMILGLLLGPLGWLLVAVGPDQRPKCGECGGAIEFRYTKCRHCGGEI